jgi:hypothetical protein
MTDRKFHKTIVQVTILSEEPIGECTLGDIDYNITEGDWSGHVECVSEETLDGKQAADALLEQASDPEFFQLTKDGNDAEDE